jgi:hypothetical protein
MPNRLANETSPYLLQHANNPVDWYPWCEEALARARQLDRPIFLSIGYSACHWCHVMEHESFENAQIAAMLNEHFVCIKVDREERPDLDHIYMTAVQMLSGRGGWPMSVFLTPQLEPFYGGTYWPPEDRLGMPGFRRVLAAVADAWVNRRDEVRRQARELAEHVARACRMELGPSAPTASALEAAEAALLRVFDRQHGGFGGAPKFPHPMDLRLLLRRWRDHPREELLFAVTHTLDKMGSGGIYDHLGGGFHRYAVDARWLVPHFEKMLYDNALLAACYTEAWQATRKPLYYRVVCETLDYLLRDLADPAGGFYSSQDADSEGEEGKYYLWTPAQVRAVLGPHAAEVFCYVYDVTEHGNFEGRNVLNLPKTVEQCARLKGMEPRELSGELEGMRQQLSEARRKRAAPGLDDKVLVNWNGLAIEALALAGSTFRIGRYVEAAARTADFLLGALRPDGRLLHSWCKGQARFDAYLDDYAALANGLVSLYEATFDERWVAAAVELADAMLERFSDREGGGFYFTAADHGPLLTRHKDVQDASVPSASGMAATALLRLARLLNRADYAEAVQSTLQSCGRFLEQHPGGAGQLLLALDLFLAPPCELVVAGGQAAARDKLLCSIRERFWPRKAIAARPGQSQQPLLDGLFAGRPFGSENPILYVCQNHACQQPLEKLDEALATLDQLAPTPRVVAC